jgi:hypothetical protein
MMPCSATAAEIARNSIPDAIPPSDESIGMALSEIWMPYRHYTALEPFIESAQPFDNQEILEAIAQAFHNMAHSDKDDAAAMRIGRRIIDVTKAYLKPRAEARAAEIQQEMESDE